MPVRADAYGSLHRKFCGNEWRTSERHHQSGEKAQGSSHAGRSAQIPGWYDGMHEVPGQADKIPNGSNRQQDSRESLCALVDRRGGFRAEAKVTKSVHPLLDEEALRVACVNGLP